MHTCIDRRRKPMLTPQARSVIYLHIERFDSDFNYLVAACQLGG